MKKLLLSAVFFLGLSSSVHAFIHQMSYFVNHEVAVSRVWNTTYSRIVCNGQAFGRTWQGVVLNAYANNVVVFPGQFIDIYVHSNFYDPMAQAWAAIDCHVW